MLIIVSIMMIDQVTQKWKPPLKLLPWISQFDKQGRSGKAISNCAPTISAIGEDSQALMSAQCTKYSHIIFPFASLFNKTCLNNQSIKIIYFCFNSYTYIVYCNHKLEFDNLTDNDIHLEFEVILVLSRLSHRTGDTGGEPLLPRPGRIKN